MAQFPDPCVTLLQASGDPFRAVPDDWIVVRGGMSPMPPPGSTFSATVGPDLAAAACAILHNKLRWAVAGMIRAQGGTIEWVPEYSTHGTMNLQHVDVMEASTTVFSEVIPNPVPKVDRIDQGK